MQTVLGITVRSLLVLLPVAATGCGSAETSQPPRPVPAGGTVLYQDKPVRNATVVFYVGEGGETASGTTDEHGTFTLTTAEESDGVPPGQYRVTVSLADEADEEDVSEDRPGPSGERIPAKYARPETTKLEAVVTETGPNTFRFVLK